jgi:Spy/CpxP family protein refolding chaperone
LVHVGDGSERLIRLVDVLTPEQRAQALETQLQSARAPTTTPSDR